MDAFSGYNQICMNKKDQEKTAFVTSQDLLLQGYAIWPEECRGDLLEAGELDVQQANWTEFGSLCGQHTCKKKESRVTSG